MTVHAIQPSDRRYKRNVMRFRATLQKMIDERRSGVNKGYLGGESADLLSILLKSDIFNGEDEMIKDEIVTFFLAGMKTVQISTTNLIYYLTKHPEYKAKLLKEILPPVELVKDNIIEGLEYDTVMDFEYLHQCYYESLRIEPPASVSVHQTMSEDTNIDVSGKPILFEKDKMFIILFSNVHHDPVQWKESHRYIPERFDRDPSNPWTLTADGKPRNALAFTPFFGGKRVCLGKTFAEVTIRFTVPLLFQHLDFEFVNPEEQMAHKDTYAVGGAKDLDLPMKLIIKNKVQI